MTDSPVHQFISIQMQANPVTKRSEHLKNNQVLRKQWYPNSTNLVYPSLYGQFINNMDLPNLPFDVGSSRMTDSPFYTIILVSQGIYTKNIAFFFSLHMITLYILKCTVNSLSDFLKYVDYFRCQVRNNENVNFA